MKKINKLNRSPALVGAIVCGIFAVMLILNFLTPYIADDFVYMFSFSTKERLQSLSDLIPSMYVHCLRMNGRVVSHTLEQLFMLMPKWVFNLCNGLVYSLFVYLLYRIANFSRRPNAFLLAAIAMGLWCFLPAFGQVALWQVGSVNYLWAVVFCLGFLLPYLLRYCVGRNILNKTWQRIGFCALSILFGMYSEVSSFVGIYLGAALLVAGAVQKKQSMKTWLLWPIGMACVGYVIMLCIPAQIQAKTAEGLSLSLLATNFIRASWMLVKYCWLPLIVLGLSFLAGIRKRISPERLILSVLFLTGALGANYMTMIAAYYPERCLCTTVTLLILAIGTLLAEFDWNRALICGFVVLTLLFAVRFTIGSMDIANCSRQFSERDAVIQQAKESGETDLVLDVVECQTMYSPFWDLRDLSDEDTATWPNSSMAKYYGVNSILGKK